MRRVKISRTITDISLGPLADRDPLPTLLLDPIRWPVLLAQNVRLLRKKLGISQEELAHRAKVHRTYMGSIERSEQNISIDNLEKIAKAIEVKPHQRLVD